VTFGQYIGQLRKAKGLSQRELAEKIGIDYTYLSKIETDKRPPPIEKTILALATVLDADLDELFGLANMIPASLCKQISPDKLRRLRSILDEEELSMQSINRPEEGDIERTQPEQVLTQEAERFRVIVENSVDGILIMNDELKIIYESPSSAGIVGYEQGVLAGRDALRLVHEDDASMLAHELNKLLQNPGGTARTIVRLRHGDGTWCAVEAVAINLLHNPAVNGIVIDFRSITDSRQYELAQVRYAVDLAIKEEDRLTDTEKEVLKLMVEGQTNFQIAERLVISTSTIKFHVGNILRKLGAANRTEAVILALRRYIVSQPKENPPLV
jgi:PAS domain S-box-containing protein